MRAWTIPAANRTGKPFSRWACVLVAAVCSALAGPALARAASSPPGLAETQAQVEPVVNQAFAMAAAATGAVPQPPAPAPAPNLAPAAPPAPPPVPATTPP